MTQVSEEKKPDVVEVTRCLHCWQSMEIRQKYNGQNCRYCFMLDCPVTEDFFCAKGKTREQGETERDKQEREQEGEKNGTTE